MNELPDSVLELLSDADLQKIANDDYDGLSDEALQIIATGKKPDASSSAETIAKGPRPAPEPSAYDEQDPGMGKQFLEQLNALAAGGLEGASWGAIQAEDIPDNRQTSKGMGNILGALVSGKAEYDLLNKAFRSIKGGNTALARILGNTALTGGRAAVTDQESPEYAENVLGSTALGAGLSGTTEGLMRYGTPTLRGIGRVLGNLSPLEAEAFRKNTELSKKLYRAMQENPDQLSKSVRDAFKGDRTFGGYEPGGINDLLSAKNAALEAEKNRQISLWGRDVSLPREMFYGTNPELQSAVGRIYAAQAGFPKVSDVSRYGQAKLNIFREKGPGTPVHRMVSEKTQFQRITPPPNKRNVVLSPKQQSELLAMSGEGAFKQATKMFPVAPKDASESMSQYAMVQADKNAYDALRKAQELKIEETMRNNTIDQIKAMKNSPQNIYGGITEGLTADESVPSPFWPVGKEPLINKAIKYKPMTKSVPEIRQEQSDLINLQKKVDDSGTNMKSLLSAGPKTEAADLRRAIDRATGSNLSGMSNMYNAGEKLSMDKNLGGLRNYLQRPVASKLIRTPEISERTKNLVGLPLLQAILYGTTSEGFDQ